MECTDGELAEVREHHEGLRRGRYYFIVEGKRLVHISHYALSKREDYGSLKCYVDLDEIRGRPKLRSL